jgi:DNA-binding IclR family transcriptional regulator
MGDTGANTYASDEKLLAILFAIKESDLHSVTELAAELDMAKSTVHDHLGSLRQDGFIVKEGGEYYVGLQFLAFGAHARSSHEIYPTSRDKVIELAERTGERVWCIVEEAGSAVYIDGAAGSNAIQTSEPIGQRRPLQGLAAGKAILAFETADRRERLLDGMSFGKTGPNTITDRERFKDELERVRETGVAYNLEEVIEGVHALSSPVRKGEVGVHGAISITGPAKRLTEQRMEGSTFPRCRGSRTRSKSIFATANAGPGDGLAATGRSDGPIDVPSRPAG